MTTETLNKARELCDTLHRQKGYVRDLEQALKPNGLNKGEITFNCGYDVLVKFDPEQFKHLVELALSFKRSDLEKTENEIKIL